MRKFSVAAVGLVLAVVVAACGGSDDKQTGDKAAASGKLSGSISVWIMDPGSPKIQGVVIMEARIERDGTVSRARVLKSIPELDDAAVEAVRQWEFTPTLLNGAPVPDSFDASTRGLIETINSLR